MHTGKDRTEDTWSRPSRSKCIEKRGSKSYNRILQSCGKEASVQYRNAMVYNMYEVGRGGMASVMRYSGMWLKSSWIGNTGLEIGV